MRIQCPETPRVPEEGSSALGKSGPKARPKGVVDGRRVKIPVLSWVGAEGRRRLKSTGSWFPVQAIEVKRCGETTLSQEASTRVYGLEAMRVKLPRKALNTINPNYLYPKPTQVGR